MNKVFHVCVHPIKRMANTPWLLLLGIVLTLVGGAAAFAIVEGVNMLDGLYWASTTMTSVGYGDLTPAHAAGKILTIAFQLWSMFILLPCAIANIVDSVRVDEHKMTHAEQEWQFKALEDIAKVNGLHLDPQPHDYE